MSFGAVACAAALLALSGYLLVHAWQHSLPAGIALSLGALALGRAALRYGERLESHDLSLRMLARLRVRFFAALAPLVPGSLPGESRGELLARFVGDVDSLQDLYLRALAPPIVALFVIVGAAVTAWLILPAAGLVVAVALLAAGIVVPLLAGRLAAAAGRRQAPARAALSAEFVEAIEGGAELAVAGHAGERVQRLAAADRLLSALARRDGIAAAAASSLASLLGGAAVVAVLLVAIPAVHSGALGGAMLVALVFLVIAAFEGIAPLAAAARRLRAVAQSAGRLEQLCERLPAVIDPAQPRSLPNGDATLVLERVRFRHDPGGPWLLDGAELTLEPGCRVALTGTSGAGKTTLAHLLVRFLDPDVGRVSLGGIDVRELAQEDVRRAVMLAGQDGHLFTTTIRENLLLGRASAPDAELWQALDATGLATWIHSLPDGLETVVGEDGDLVSGGQRQRIGLARALLADCRFLILDEPTAHLDQDTAAVAMSALMHAAGDRGVLVITHRREGLECFDRVLELLDGAITRRPTEPAARSRGPRVRARRASAPSPACL
jgi:thiol reductant ABC exporter CydC subunit